jgi:N-acetylglucosaminyldiphosphoundecaprenol N-acetyl-beta-D-mannosaminyltransferase
MKNVEISSKEASLERVDILGLKVNRLDMLGALQQVDKLIEEDKKHFVVFPNLFCLTHGRREPEYLEILNAADLTLPDGTPLVWASHLLRQPVGSRVCGPDFFELMIERSAARGYKVYFMGGGGAEKVAEHCQKNHPSLQVVGTWTPPYGPVDGQLNERILADIAKAKPDILWVGLGAPRQEQWIWKNRDLIEARVSFAVGGAFDYYTGSRQRAPQWLRDSGMEWGYRISQDISLLWKKRYFAYIHEFFLPLLLEAARQTVR